MLRHAQVVLGIIKIIVCEPPREVEDLAPQQTKCRSRPPSQRKRDLARQDAFHENHRVKSKQALQDIEDKINKVMYFSFGDALTAEKQVDFLIQKTAAVVPVTTWAVGFYSGFLRRSTSYTAGLTA